MDILVEDGTGLVTANAYLSAEEADDILSVNIHSQWSVLSDDTTKENLIMWASRILDERVRWFGKKTHETSGLAWPRSHIRDKENIMVDDSVVPRAVKIATALLAEHLIAGNPEVANTGSNLTSLQVDVIALKFDARLAPEKYPAEIGYALRGLGSVSMGRGGPKRIVKH
jgi:hypothetical protein